MLIGDTLLENFVFCRVDVMFMIMTVIHTCAFERFLPHKGFALELCLHAGGSCKLLEELKGNFHWGDESIKSLLKNGPFYPWGRKGGISMRKVLGTG